MSTSVDLEVITENISRCYDAEGVPNRSEIERLLRVYTKRHDISDRVAKALVKDAEEIVGQRVAAEKSIAANRVPEPPARARLDYCAREYAGWTSSDGDVPGHFASKPPGSRCFWAVEWLYSDGRSVLTLSPASLNMNAHDMSDQELLIELLDFLEHDNDAYDRFWKPSYGLERSAQDAYDQLRSGNSNLARQILGDIRKCQGQYLAPWSPPESVMVARWRPGWTSRTRVEAIDDYLDLAKKKTLTGNPLVDAWARGGV